MTLEPVYEGVHASRGIKLSKGEMKNLQIIVPMSQQQWQVEKNDKFIKFSHTQKN